MSERPEIVPVGQIPELGVVPNKMHSFVIRPERFGEPMKSFQPEEMPVWDLAPVWVKFMIPHLSESCMSLGVARMAKLSPSGPSVKL